VIYLIKRRDSSVMEFFLLQIYTQLPVYIPSKLRPEVLSNIYMPIQDVLQKNVNLFLSEEKIMS
jgi:hypothetical protein